MTSILPPEGMPRRKTNRRQRSEALKRFDEAAQKYAFRGTYSGSNQYNEVVDEYWSAYKELAQILDCPLI